MLHGLCRNKVMPAANLCVTGIERVLLRQWADLKKLEVCVRLPA
jgi:hypothetical protein